jgi:hypothetical protein
MYHEIKSTEACNISYIKNNASDTEHSEGIAFLITILQLLSEGTEHVSALWW